MARYDLYRSPGGIGYLLDVQADILEDLNTRVVVPLVPKSSSKVVPRLNPEFDIDGQSFVMFTQLIATVPVSRLGLRQDNLLSRHDDVVGALDMLFQGF